MKKVILLFLILTGCLWKKPSSDQGEKDKANPHPPDHLVIEEEKKADQGEIKDATPLPSSENPDKKPLEDCEKLKSVFKKLCDHKKRLIERNKDL